MTFQINEAATDGELCRFVMQSYRSFEQKFYENVFDHLPPTHRLADDGEQPTVIALGNPVRVELLRGASPHFIASLMRESGAESCVSRLVDMMAMMTRAHSRQFQGLEHAADR